MHVGCQGPRPRFQGTWPHLVAYLQASLAHRAGVDGHVYGRATGAITI